MAAQALVAAGRSVGDGTGSERPVHSLHAYFLRPGDPKIPILYQVDRIRDGKSFTTRRVAAIQRGKQFSICPPSFHVPEEGVSHQQLVPDAPDPETLPTWTEVMAPHAAALGDWYTRPRPIDVRPVGDPIRTSPDSAPRQPANQMWLRTDGKLPDEPLLHACLVAYASDMTLLDTIMAPHGLIWGRARKPALTTPCGSTDPSGPMSGCSTTNAARPRSGARGLATRTIYTRDGALAVSVVQEGCDCG